ncbi:MAG: MerR family transcriptional regulator [Bacteroidales bacterium]|jgi:DNA-binding transcriptional MerR regulator|nr:MerR family transcriptional regulator [Bacteroidales bacterium]
MNETKLYYTIGEVAQHLGENVSLVRYWSDQFSNVLRPARNNKGNRLFSPEDLRRLELIHYLVKDQGMTLEGAKQQMKANPEGVNRREDVVRSLERIRDELKVIAAGLSEIKSNA